MAAHAPLSPSATQRAHPRSHSMNILPSLQPILNELTQRFGNRLSVLSAERPNEIYFESQMELVPGFCAQLYKKWNGRLVSLFADDVRAVVGQASRLSPEGVS